MMYIELCGCEMKLNGFVSEELGCVFLMWALLGLMIAKLAFNYLTVLFIKVL